MKVTAITTPIFHPGDDLFEFIAGSVESLSERSVLVVTSKIVSYWQGRLVRFGSEYESVKTFKHELARREADYYLDPKESKYNLMFTVTNQTLAVNAGIDESNAEDGKLILWPENPQQCVNEIWDWARDYYGVGELGVTLSDSKTYPLRWGVTGTCIASCGFEPLFSYVGQEDLFGYRMKMEKTNVAEALTIAAVLEMGEGAESKPVAIVDDISNIQFVDHVPSVEELSELEIALDEDFFEPLLSAVRWKKGGRP